MVQLPNSYIEYVKNGGITFGETNLEWADYFDLEPQDKVSEFNQDIEISNYAPDFIAFASNGGGDVYVFNSSGAIFLLPLVGMEPNAAISIANSWSELISHVINT